VGFKSRTSSFQHQPLNLISSTKIPYFHTRFDCQCIYTWTLNHYCTKTLEKAKASRISVGCQRPSTPGAYQTRQNGSAVVLDREILLVSAHSYTRHPTAKSTKSFPRACTSNQILWASRPGNCTHPDPRMGGLAHHPRPNIWNLYPPNRGVMHTHPFPSVTGTKAAIPPP
jgi:hypothetical protein